MPSYLPQAKIRCPAPASSTAIAWVNTSPAGVGTISRGDDRGSGPSSGSSPAREPAAPIAEPGPAAGPVVPIAEPGPAAGPVAPCAERGPAAGAPAAGAPSASGLPSATLRPVIASSASPHGSGFITIPGPPPNGVSSTVRCGSCAQERRSCTPKTMSPRCAALPISETPSGPKYSGKIVMISMRSVGLLRFHDPPLTRPLAW